MWVTRDYQIKEVPIATHPGCSQRRYFLDAVQVPYPARHMRAIAPCLKSVFNCDQLSECVDRKNKLSVAIRYRDIAEQVYSQWTEYSESRYYVQSQAMGEHFDKIWVGLDRIEAIDLPRTTCGLHLNVEGPVCYLLVIKILDELCGKGLGDQLYKLTIEFAKQVGCKTVVQYPSGQTPTGESRSSYLSRRGWKPVPGSEEMCFDLEEGYTQRHYRRTKRGYEDSGDLSNE